MGGAHPTAGAQLDPDFETTRDAPDISPGVQAVRNPCLKDSSLWLKELAGESAYFSCPASPISSRGQIGFDSRLADLFRQALELLDPLG